jgi:hypothetical protein
VTDSVMVGAALVGSLVAPWLSTALGPRGVVLLLAAASLATVALLGHRGPPVAAVRVPAQRTPRQRARVPQPAALAEPEPDACDVLHLCDGVALPEPVALLEPDS